MSALPRRAFFGLRLASGRRAFSREGAHVAAALVGSAAARAGIVAGDVVARVGDVVIDSASAWAEASRRAGAHEAVEVEILRGAARRVVEIAASPWPHETLDGASVEHGHVVVRGARLRTIVTTPDVASRAPTGRSPAVLYLQGISCDSIELPPSTPTPVRRLVHGLGASGFVTMRVEKRGVGDSEGGVPTRVDFETELDGFRAALAALRARDDVEADAVFLFGHSVGASVAPLLGCETPVRGVVVFGATAVPWLDELERTTRRQLALREVAAEDVERVVALQRASLARDPDATMILGRTAAYHRQLGRVDLAAAWRSLAAPTLVLAGEHDWVVAEDEAREVADLARA
ncbi:MAG: alpha/beta fold hydrolase, partial [Deltaproteobacteria bacterium]|nr:alpha/beta fold hydrolase [Deltaproteobacteria bacterium]